ncbi:hypothetical protein SD70_26970 [Gordoniibacillus kamchatkensis]|uniref:Carbohydrate kinase n=2 Tax=Gordoniibacillus kamchatkensis TaxID=1590651 RepID=A0ABR5ABZ3_9BACL|nr:hypothetical protein SD70_26970 [Paenibacillus sp. VKM B-2647]
MSGFGTLLLSLDIGTTHCKAALFDERGALLRMAKRETVRIRDGAFGECYDPEALWAAAAGLIREVAGAAAGQEPLPIAAIGIDGMAETGLLVGADGAARTPLLPWFSRIADAQAARIEAEGDAFERFAATGLRSSYKYGLAKLLWLRERAPELLSGARWLSAADYVAYRLTGAAGTDYTLAARTFAFRIDRKMWDAPWIRHFGLDPGLFPEARPSGASLAGARADAARALGLPAGVPVAVAGHDHVCAALAAGATAPGRIMDSMGTAETLVGMLPERPLTRADLASGLSFGLHAVPGALFWMGGISASGGSVEWLRDALGGGARLEYGDVLRLLADAPAEPTGILYYPYLAGAGAPQPDSAARAAFIGLAEGHGRAELLKAVLEGTANEMESIRRAAQTVAGAPIAAATVVGGGTRNPYWLQIKADVSGCTLHVAETEEAALLGAALLAGIAAGVYRDAAEAQAAASVGRDMRAVGPDPDRHEAYRRLYEEGYMALQQPLRLLYRSMAFRTWTAL